MCFLFFAFGVNTSGGIEGSVIYNNLFLAF